MPITIFDANTRIKRGSLFGRKRSKETYSIRKKYGLLDEDKQRKKNTNTNKQKRNFAFYWCCPCFPKSTSSDYA